MRRAPPGTTIPVGVRTAGTEAAYPCLWYLTARMRRAVRRFPARCARSQRVHGEFLITRQWVCGRGPSSQIAKRRDEGSRVGMLLQRLVLAAFVHAVQREYAARRSRRRID